jgi:hypothetical protein
MILGKYSFGIGDRFCHQGKPQLAALIKAKEQGLDIIPVWNKSNREHTIIGTTPADTRKEANDAIMAYGWDGSYFVDADHIGLNNSSSTAIFSRLMLLISLASRQMKPV